MEQNPYASPAVEEPTFAFDPENVQVASRGRRFANLIIDNIFIQLLSAGLGFAFGLSFIAYFGQDGVISKEQEDWLERWGKLLGVLISLGYFIVAEACWQKTVGKLVTNTIVVSETGQKPTFKQIVGRNLARFIPFEAFSFLSSENPAGLHDTLSKTRVIDSIVREENVAE